MEHRIEGRVDESGVFTGSVRAFGVMLPDRCVIQPPRDLRIPDRSNNRVGPFDIYIDIDGIHSREHDATRERNTIVTATLPESTRGSWCSGTDCAVLPYGRTDNDFFEIEFRRSKSVGREFWNHRQVVRTHRDRSKSQPEPQGQGGKEGLLDNHTRRRRSGNSSPTC